MILLLVGSVAIVFWYETLDPESDAGLRMVIEWVDLALVVFFVSEWLWRVKRSGDRAKEYALRYSWELLGMVPILLPLPAFLRTLRLLRLIRILRVFRSVGEAMGAWDRVAKKGHLGKIGIASGVVTGVGALLVWLMERDNNPALDSFGESLWWSIVTVTTVGYGDITPISLTGRFIAAMLMVTGIGTIASLASGVSSALIMPDDEAAADAGGDGGAKAPVTFVAELQVLSDLHERGHLTDAEFSDAKAKVLAAA